MNRLTIALYILYMFDIALMRLSSFPPHLPYKVYMENHKGITSLPASLSHATYL